MDQSDAEGPELEYYMNKCQLLEREIEEVKKENRTRIEENERQRKKINKLMNDITKKDKEIQNYLNEIEEHKANEELNYYIETLDTIIDEKDNSIEEMKKQLKDFDMIKKENKQLQQKVNQLKQLLTKINKVYSEKISQLEKDLQDEKNKTTNKAFIDMLNSRITFLESELKKRDTLLKDKVHVQDIIIDTFYIKK